MSVDNPQIILFVFYHESWRDLLLWTIIEGVSPPRHKPLRRFLQQSSTVASSTSHIAPVFDMSYSDNSRIDSVTILTYERDVCKPVRLVVI